MIKTLLFVGIGSFAGGALRYAVGQMLKGVVGGAFPLGTFVVNVVGCFLIGLFNGLFARATNVEISPDIRLMLTVGLCGGFTTFSTFVNESFFLMRGSQLAVAILYLVLSLVIGTLALWGGYNIVK